MNARDSFLARRYRVELISAAALGVACGGIATGIAVADLPLGALRRQDWVNLGVGGFVLALSLLILVRHVRWLDSAVPESRAVKPRS